MNVGVGDFTPVESLTQPAREHFTMTRFNATAISGVTAYELSRAIATIRYFKGVEKAVLRTLVDHYPRVWPSVETIAEESGWALTPVRGALSGLAKDNWICPVSATRENPAGRRGGRFNSEQYIINDRKILNALAAQNLEDGIVSGRIPTIETHRVAVGIDDGNPPSPERNPSRGVGNPSFGEQTHRVASQNPSPDDGEEVIEPIIEETKEESREEEHDAPSAPSRTSKSKPSRSRSTGGQDMGALVQAIKKAALDVSEGKAVFYGKNTKAIKQALIDNPSLDRESILSAVRSRVRDMDEFQLKHCGSDLAEVLVALIQYKDEAREAQERQDARVAEILAESEASSKAKAEERAREEQSEEEERTRCIDGLFGHPEPVTT